MIVKVGLDVRSDLREDREAHGGRQTREAAVRALLIAAVVAVLVLAIIVWPLILGTSAVPYARIVLQCPTCLGRSTFASTTRPPPRSRWYAPAV